jgi:hypothetical protein
MERAASLEFPPGAGQAQFFAGDFGKRQSVTNFIKK